MSLPSLWLHVAWQAPAPDCSCHWQRSRQWRRSLSVRTAVFQMSHVHVPQSDCWQVPQQLQRVRQPTWLSAPVCFHASTVCYASYKLPRYPWFDIWVLVPCATLVVLGIKTSLAASVLVLDMLWDSARLLWHGL